MTLEPKRTLWDVQPCDWLADQVKADDQVKTDPMLYVTDVYVFIRSSSTPEAFDTRTYLLVHQKSKPLEPFRSSGTNGTTKGANSSFSPGTLTQPSLYTKTGARK